MKLTGMLPLRTYRGIAALMLSCMMMLGCATRVPMPSQPAVFKVPQHTLHVIQQRADEPARHAVLAVRSEGDSTYWTLIDLLGVPLARQILQNGQWRNDGFLPPNGDARALFISLIFAWTPQSELSSHYQRHNIKIEDDTRTLSTKGRPVLTVTTAVSGDIRLDFSHGVSWVVKPLREGQ